MLRASRHEHALGMVRYSAEKEDNSDFVSCAVLCWKLVLMCLFYQYPNPIPTTRTQGVSLGFQRFGLLSRNAGDQPSVNLINTAVILNNVFR